MLAQSLFDLVGRAHTARIAVAQVIDEARPTDFVDVLGGGMQE